jgi:WD40 repeat protein
VSSSAIANTKCTQPPDRKNLYKNISMRYPQPFSNFSRSCLLMVFTTIASCLQAQKPVLGIPRGHTDMVSSLQFYRGQLVTTGMETTYHFWNMERGLLLRSEKAYTRSFFGPINAAGQARAEHVDPTSGYIYTIDVNTGQKLEVELPETEPDFSYQEGEQRADGTVAYEIYRGDGALIATVDLPIYSDISDYNAAANAILVIVPSDEDGGDRQIGYRREYLLGEKKFRDLEFNSPTEDGTTESFWPDLPGSIYSPDGTMIVSPSMAGGIYVFDRASGQLKFDLSSHVRVVNDLAVNAGGTKIMLQTPQRVVSRFKRAEPDNRVIKWNWAESNVVEESRGATSVPPPSRSENDGLALLVTKANLSDDYSHACAFNLIKLRGHEEIGQRRIVWDEAEFKKVGSSRFSSAAVDGQRRVAVGTAGGHILVFDGKGDYQFSLAGHKEGVLGITFFQDGKKLVSSANDGSILIWDLETRAVLATLMLLNDHDWVVAGPDNRFDASPGALPYLYFVVPTAGDESEIIGLDQMKERYFEPGLLQKLLGFSDQPLRSVRGLETVRLYPKLRVDKSSAESEALTVTVEARSGSVGRVSMAINGTEVEADLDPGRGKVINIDLGRDEYKRRFLYDNTIEFRVYNQDGSLRSPPYEIEHVYGRGARVRGAVGGAGQERELSVEQYREASLHVLCIGTSDYTEGGEKSLDLNFPDHDAVAFSRAMQMVGKELFNTNGQVNVHCLTTTAANKDSLAKRGIAWTFATKEHIEAAFAEMARVAKPQDVVLIYFSGHGKTFPVDGNDQFHYLTNEASRANISTLSLRRNTTISSTEIREWLKQSVASKKVLIIDACNSGQIIDDIAAASKELNGSQIRALDQMSDRAGTYLLAGSASDMVSYEASNYGHGLLTYALLEGMGGDAVRADEENPAAHFVNVTELFDYAQRRVTKLAADISGVQQPQLNYPVRAGTFAVGIFNENTLIPLNAAKPTVLSSRLTDANFGDELGLERELNEMLQAEKSLVANARFVYVPGKKLPNAYQVRGQYSVDGDMVTVKAFLIKDDKAVATLTVEPGRQGMIADNIRVALVRALRKLN